MSIFKKKSYFETHRYFFRGKKVYIQHRWGIPIDLILVMKTYNKLYNIPKKLIEQYRASDIAKHDLEIFIKVRMGIEAGEFKRRKTPSGTLSDFISTEML